MATPANTTAPLMIAERIARLPELSMDDLWGLWDEHFQTRPAHHHRGWLESRLAYRIQELALGGLKPATKRKLERIGQEFHELAELDSYLPPGERETIGMALGIRPWTMQWVTGIKKKPT